MFNCGRAAAIWSARCSLNPIDAMLIGHPAHPELIEPMLDWAEARYREKGSDHLDDRGDGEQRRAV